MHCYLLVSNLSRPDWSLICHSHRKKNPKVCLTVLFFSTSSPSLFSTVFLSPSITSVWQVTDGWRGENNVLWPSVLPSSSAPGSNSLSQQAVGGRAAAPLPASLPTPPESIALRHHTNDPLKSMHHSTVHHQQWPAMWFRRERQREKDGELLRVNIKIEMEEESGKRATGRQKKENKNRNRNTELMLGLNDLRKISSCEFSNQYCHYESNCDYFFYV